MTMDTETSTQRIERLTEKAKVFLNNNIKTFIKDVYNNYYFCYIKEIYSDWIIIENFKGQRNGEITRILFVDILDIKEYKDKEDLK